MHMNLGFLLRIFVVLRCFALVGKSASVTKTGHAGF